MKLQQNGRFFFGGDGSIDTIGVFRALQLGDMLCAVPAFRALRDAFPTAEITFIGLPWAERFAKRFPDYIDRFLPFPGHPALPEFEACPENFPAFLNTAQRKDFDLLFQLHGSGEITNPLLSLFCAKEFAGFHKEGHWRPNSECFLMYPENLHETRRLLRLLQFLGIPAEDEELEFPLLSNDLLEADCIIEQLRMKQYICIHCGSRSAGRRWSHDRFARVGDVLAQQGYEILLTGSLEERPLADRVCAAMKNGCINLAGKTSIGALAAILQRSELLICNDTGVSHLACAIKAPSVVVFSGSDPIRWAPLNRDLHRVCLPRENRPVTVDSVLSEAMTMLRQPAHAT